MVRSAFLATLVVGAVCAGSASAQAPPTPPDDYALTNARIVTAPGRVIERGTVVVRDGRITAVGPQVAVPAGAIRVDLAGHTIYPGLIDAASTFGLPEVTGQNAQPGAELMPARSAADVWTATDANVEAMRNAGFTTLGLAFNGGIFPGRVAAVSTGGSTRSPVLRSPIAQQVVFGRRRGGYPGTLMGALAYVKQSFFDVQHDVRARQAWERVPSGPRPDYDPEHRALLPAATGELPVWFNASAERELSRVPALAGEIGVRSYVIVGAQEGYRSIDALKRAAQPVIVSLDWPSATELSGRAFELQVTPVSGTNPARAEADSVALRAARGNAAALARAGIPFALSTHGLPNPASMRDRLRATVEAGLSADDALRALTITPARLLGLENAIGTIETGKLANLVITQGDLFARNTRVRHVFVEGVRYDVPEPSAPARGGGPGGGRGGGGGQRGGGGGVTNSAVGMWVGEMDGPTGLIEFRLDITATGDSLTARMSSEMMGLAELRGAQTGDEITLSGSAQPPGMNVMALTINGRVTGDDLRATLTVQGRSPINFTARRRTDGAPNLEGGR